MLNKVFKWGGLAVSFIGIVSLIVGAMDTRPLGSGQIFMQVGAIFFVGGVLIHLLVLVIERLRSMTHILSDIDTTLSIQTMPEPVVQEEPRFHEQIKEEKTNNSFILPIPMPDFSDFTSKEIVKPRVFSAPKPDYFQEPPPSEAVKADVFDIPTPIEAAPAAPLERLKENNERLSQIARDFPELDAILNRNKEPIKEPEPVAPAPVSIIREGTISGIDFRLYSDGTIEADFEDGRHRFAGINEFRNYVENK